MEIQEKDGHSKVIEKAPTPTVRQQSAKSEAKSHKTTGTQKTITTNQTHKDVGGGYIGELADQAIGIFEGEFET
jgi:hypothetical protein